MSRKKPAADDKGRCAYCLRVTASPRKPVYELSSDGSSARWSHHRTRVFLEGVEIRPLCSLTPPTLSTVLR